MKLQLCSTYQCSVLTSDVSCFPSLENNRWNRSVISNDQSILVPAVSLSLYVSVFTSLCHSLSSLRSSSVFIVNRIAKYLPSLN